jgi:hypothetical protein
VPVAEAADMEGILARKKLVQTGAMATTDVCAGLRERDRDPKFGTTVSDDDTDGRWNRWSGAVHARCAAKMAA